MIIRLQNKDASRHWNIDVVKRCRFLFDERTQKLRQHWAELAGPGAPSLRLLRDEGLLLPAKFIGIDKLKKDDIFSGVDLGDDCELSDQKSLRNWMYQEHRPIGVLNWDSYRLGMGASFEEDLQASMEFANTQQVDRSMLQFVLIINVGLDRGATLETFQEVLYRVAGHKFVPSNACTYPGEKSERLNYAIIFGP